MFRRPSHLLAAATGLTLALSLHSPSARSQSATKADASVEKPCTEADFLIGDWTISRADKEGEITADANWTAEPRSRCFLIERWKGRNGSRDYDGLMAYSNVTHSWSYVYVSAGAMRARQEDGVLVGDGIQFVPADVKPDGKVRQFAYVNLGNGRVREVQRVSADGGKTWTDEFNLIWVRKKE